ncbi:otoancorin-like, partial [Scyliorhinus torazame]|uniref:otoancorin-like n=1 Tax=Scyliorhinus torazame TaxID=75743 RepID=UPI003B5CAE68
LTCAADKLKNFLGSLTTDFLQENLDSFLNQIPSDLLLYLGEEYTCRRFAKACGTFLEKVVDIRLELLPRSSPVRGCVRDAAVRCLNKGVSSLDESDVGKLGMLVCEFTDRNITDLPDSVFAAVVTKLGRCQQFHSTAKNSLNSKLLRIFGAVPEWTEDTVTSLGSMITLLSEDSLSGLPNVAFVKEALQKYSAPQDSAGAPASPEFGDASANLLQSQTKVFIIVVGVESAAESAGARAAVCSVVPSVEQIQELGEANTLWSVQQLECITTDTFEDTVDVLAAIQDFSYEQCQALMEKAKEAWGPTSAFDQYQLGYLRSLLSVLPVSEIKLLNLVSIDTLESMEASPTWTQEKRAAVLERYLELNNITTADLDTIQFSGLGNFICGMKEAQINQLQNDAVRNAARSFGQLTCPPDVLDLLKRKMAVVFGPMSGWSDAQMSQLGNVAAGASSQDLMSLSRSVMPYVSSTAVACIPPERFQALSVSQLENLGPENAAAVTKAQFEALSEDQQSAVNEALGIPAKVSKILAVSHSP